MMQGFVLCALSLLGQPERGLLFASMPQAGCNQADVIPPADMLATLVAFNIATRKIYATSPGDVVTISDLQEALAPFLTKEVALFVEGGPGLYKGIDAVIEYATIPAPALAMGFRHYTTGDAGGAPSKLLVGANTVETTVLVEATFFANDTEPPYQLPQPMQSRNRFTFERKGPSCDAFISDWYVFLTPSFAQHLVNEVWATNYTKFYGPHDICKFHENYCVDDYKQYTNFEACMSYLLSIPLTSSKCGERLLTGGHSRACRAKHRNMLALNPKHCFHIGPNRRADGTPNRDPDGGWKCDDSECDLAADGQAEVQVGIPHEAWFAASLGYDDWVQKHFVDQGDYKFPASA